ncbi:sulfite reductase subunit alpha [Cupriavidus pinatubonensis]|uniref:NADPH--hemoprotein reductase n=1 Tax=Cupriavidus pinatubonensis TaxID=248026 RepID=A0ABM8XRM7_9BURK|nr:sulfite reductase flavoprotein subunit alpha [Cupriavidus pinatubonensis]CAG9182937.1 Sulfite reductase [NADPH] flavoprotein alpha-component [Cupriavidus pinatubonensis]
MNPFTACWLAAVAGVCVAMLSPSRAGMAAGVLLAYAGFCGAVVDHHRRRRARVASLAVSGAHQEGATLVAYASQTGFGEQLAMQTATALQGAGMPVHLLSFEELDARRLAKFRQVLFVVSTTGEGDAPDSASGFARRLLAGGGHDALRQLRYGVLALGDSSYARFCAFGHALSDWLQCHNARPLFDLIEVDNGDAGALRHWQNHLSALSGGAEIADWERPRYEHWQLAAREHLNPGSDGAPAFHLVLRPEGAVPGWQAGDIAEVGPCHDPADIGRLLSHLNMDGAAPVRCDAQTVTLAEALATRLLLAEAHLATMRALPPQQLVDALSPLPHREYSIASLPQDGQVELLVRQTRHVDGRLGLASGWLTSHTPVGARIALRIRTNRSFHPPADDRPLVLIGNGTGLAGLRGHLKARALAGRHRNWLFFGERSARHDGFFADELAAWQAEGVLERVDLVYSRDGNALRYVQDALRERAPALREWVEAGAAIYVCGSLQGMAGGVNDALADVLGEAGLRRLTEQGRYRRDVY